MLIEMADVGKTYHMGHVAVHAVKSISLHVAPGEFLAIMGPSGSGKTTLLNLIGCLDLPSRGHYCLRGRDVRSLNDAQLSRLRGEGIGFVFQDYSLLPRLSAWRNVELPHYYAHGRGNRARASDLLGQVGLADRIHHKPTELSGGEQQRVALARALVNQPFLLLADEPTGNLDTKSGDELMDLLEHLNIEGGLTIIMVTHDPAIGARARRVVHLLDGELAGDGSPDGQHLELAAMSPRH
jgi:putative ABC transport system ATP-binding protein